jgi:hypothetical protein
MTRWSEADLVALQARTVGPTGTVNRNPVPITSRVTKYGNKPTMVDGIPFDSLAEARRYNELKLFVHAGDLSNLELQPKFPLVVNGELVCTYIADFSYEQRGYRVIEDVKSRASKTRAYRIKVKLLKALTGIIVREVA